MSQIPPPSLHPKGSKARVLLSSVFGPYGRDDEFGSRSINPMELYHNQVTRVQGPFSLRMFHRSWGLMFIQENISAPSVLLDFPSRERFIEELVSGGYDIVGLSSIVMNVGKIREMCRLVRRYSPGSAIVVGGHVAAFPQLEEMIDADHVVRGEGVRWLRWYLGEDPAAPIRHPLILSGFGQRALGVGAKPDHNSRAATVIPSVGCPLGCNFCATSEFFGGKGRFENFYDSGQELFEVMLQIEQQGNVQSFFVMDENFLLHRRRALQLLELMKKHGKSWSLYVFSSANAIRKYSFEELVALGISWVWMGLESPNSSYSKLKNADTRSLVRELRECGIRVLGSTIIGLEHHTPSNLAAEVDYAVSHGTDFHQFMLYTPLPGTPLYQQLESEGKLLPAVNPADIHGQYKFNFLHPAISRDHSKILLDGAFERDYDMNGPSLFRICQTALRGWKKHGDHPDRRIRERFRRESQDLRRSYAAMLWAMEKYFKRINPRIGDNIRVLRHELQREFGWLTRFFAYAGGPFLLWTSRREARRLTKGFRYEPPTFVERRNWAEEKC
jgi:radical SAM superfamily enzyme YgiQ (UPF0313 family)